MNNLINILYIILILLIFVVIALIFSFVIIKAKEKKSKEKTDLPTEENNQRVDDKSKIAKEYNTQSIFDFMEFEGVEDNMIVQKKGKKFLMAIECQGINYDLMSETEKASTEQGFISFLNTLKDPVQIYIQTRTVNLEKNIQQYEERVNKVGDELNLKEYKLKQYIDRKMNDNFRRDLETEIIREKNLYSYGRDIIADTKRMSLNKNVLKKKYYIIIKYYYEPEGEDLRTKDEIKEIAFSNLYTRAASLIRVLSGIGIVGKTLDSFELVDLLYNAYNRDDSEVFGIDRAIESGFNEIYIETQNVIDKKIEALNKEIEIKAKDMALKAIGEARDERQKELENTEINIEEIIMKLAKKVVKDNEEKIGKEVTDKAIKKIEGKEGGVKSDVKEKTKEPGKKRRVG